LKDTSWLFSDFLDEDGLLVAGDDNKVYDKKYSRNTDDSLAAVVNLKPK